MVFPSGYLPVLLCLSYYNITAQLSLFMFAYVLPTLFPTFCLIYHIAPIISIAHLNAKLFMSIALSKSFIDSSALRLYNLLRIIFLMVNWKLPGLFFFNQFNQEKYYSIFIMLPRNSSLPSSILLQTPLQLTGYYSRVVIKAIIPHEFALISITSLYFRQRQFLRIP